MVKKLVQKILKRKKIVIKKFNFFKKLLPYIYLSFISLLYIINYFNFLEYYIIYTL